MGDSEDNAKFEEVMNETTAEYVAEIIERYSWKVPGGPLRDKYARKWLKRTLLSCKYNLKK